MATDQDLCIYEDCGFCAAAAQKIDEEVDEYKQYEHVTCKACYARGSATDIESGELVPYDSVNLETGVRLAVIDSNDLQRLELGSAALIDICADFKSEVEDLDLREEYLKGMLEQLDAQQPDSRTHLEEIEHEKVDHNRELEAVRQRKMKLHYLVADLQALEDTIASIQEQEV